MPLFTDDYVVLDYETGGFAGTSGFRPVEVAILEYRSGVVSARSTIVNPMDPGFILSDGAEKTHGISMTKIAAEGKPARAVAERMHEELSAHDLPIWAHNGVKFDIPLFDQECARYGKKPFHRSRFRDSAALFKGRALGAEPFADETLYQYFVRVLNTPKKGLKFALDFISEVVDVGLRKIECEDGMPTLEAHPSLGIPNELLRQVEQLGAHRAKYDVLLTHAVIQTLKKDPYFKEFPDA